MHASLVATLVLAVSIVSPTLSAPLAIRDSLFNGVAVRDTSSLPEGIIDFESSLLHSPKPEGDPVAF
ncbi:hypothetical protein EI94DRAFT_1802925 [Lactarius quietus]|nr:hypothetical protein EI94DRAFT_1802925 [Lactarius quietus]